MRLNEATSSTGMTLHAAADLQDHLLTAANDLERLQRLLSDACDTLLAEFCAATHQLRHVQAVPAQHSNGVERAIAHLGDAVTALQFQDMASQLIAHTHRRLQHCTDNLAREVFVGDEDGDSVVEAPPLRPNPVVQDEMDAGSIELF